ncbi:hypothetical protein Kpol_1004p64 [Vanderwaltozyma polyspora DSM 70294]|uniref:Mediator of RNA polymerase II transcription subunit 20 n=1 Tax=Vanderwaltozyma polyspora (strain ATCC 22028 / DSM 70294 / BCRC 21397 / CBS 2163 / NBRC 10782 / NRRL Y-8283 / UCD 57-17) TaxID=436907 RepID=A7TJB8_VANPO|nr:uncharacterized protein Kpol_1004p64 [Vanderwaltozyma polyspora DSM 70294]EDO17687.1 hypothetical protein Kpol_1004p64 [Vanderwaltozyma polyspora DSM 70294]
MVRTAVIFLERATPGTLTEFKDALSNMLSSILDPWSVEFKTYRCSIKNLPEGSSKVMHSVSFSHHDKRSILIQNKNAIITTSNSKDIPNSLIFNGCSTGTAEPIDSILSTKLSNIWSQRQGIRGDAGETLKTAELLVRAVNLFSSTGFKGLLIELESIEDISEDEFMKSLQNIRSILNDINSKDFKVSTDQLYPDKQNYLGDLAYQYVRVLEV